MLRINVKNMKKMLVKGILPVGIISLIFCAFFNLNLGLGFLVAIIYGIFVMGLNGESITKLIKFIIKEIISYWEIYLVVLLLGANIASWMSSGILAQMMYLGLSVINVDNYCIVAFLITALVAIFMGTGLGTLSTIGLVFIGIGKSLGFNIALVVGLLVSASYIADILSPMSLLLNLNLKSNEIKYKNYLRKFFPYLFGSVVITLLLYILIFSNQVISFEVGYTLELQRAIVNFFNINYFMLLIPILNIVLAVIGINLSVNFIASIIVGSVFSIIMQGNSIVNQITYLIKGYYPNNMSNQISLFFNGGGIFGTANIVFIIAMALAFAFLLNYSGSLKRIKRNFIRGEKPMQVLVGNALFSIFMTSVGCDQSLGILIPSKESKLDYENLGWKKEKLSADISASGVIIAPIEPWNVNALVIFGFTGISALQFGQYAYICFIMPIWMIVYNYLVNIFRKKQNEIF